MFTSTHHKWFEELVKAWLGTQDGIPVAEVQARLEPLLCLPAPPTGLNDGAPWRAEALSKVSDSIVGAFAVESTVIAAACIAHCRTATCTATNWVHTVALEAVE